MHALAIISQKEILRIILDYYGPSLDRVIILTISVQTLRDHDCEVHELWGDGQRAIEWIGDRNVMEVQAEIDAAERARDRSPSPACWLSEDWTGERPRDWRRGSRQDSSPLFFRPERSEWDRDHDWSIYSGDS